MILMAYRSKNLDLDLIDYLLSRNKKEIQFEIVGKVWIA